MTKETAVIAISILTAFGTVSFLLLIVGLFRPTLVMKRASLQTRGGIIFFWGGLWILATIGATIVAAIAGQNLPTTPASEPRDYYVGASGANIRECPQLSCKVVNTIPQNTLLSFPGDLYNKYPNWAEVTLPSGQVGYISKTALSSEVTEVAAPSTPSANEILLAPFAPQGPFLVGYSYTMSFCYPESARSGATCGGLPHETQNPVGGSPPYSIIKKFGFIPPGMTLELNGLLSGSPTTVGTYNFKLCAKDLQMNEGCQDFTFVVEREKEILAEPTLPSQPAPTPQPVEESVPDYGHTLESSSCSRSQKPGTISTFWDMRIVAQGTAWGPVGSSVFMSGWGYEHTCGAWTNVNPKSSNGQYCKRGPGDPEKTTWTLDSASSTELTTYRVFVTSGCCYPVTKEYPFKHTKILDRPCN